MVQFGEKRHCRLHFKIGNLAILSVYHNQLVCFQKTVTNSPKVNQVTGRIIGAVGYKRNKKERDDLVKNSKLKEEIEETNKKLKIWDTMRQPDGMRLMEQMEDIGQEYRLKTKKKKKIWIIFFDFILLFFSLDVTDSQRERFERQEDEFLNNFLEDHDGIESPIPSISSIIHDYHVDSLPDDDGIAGRAETFLEDNMADLEDAPPILLVQLSEHANLDKFKDIFIIGKVGNRTFTPVDRLVACRLKTANKTKKKANAGPPSATSSKLGGGGDKAMLQHLNDAIRSVGRREAIGKTLALVRSRAKDNSVDDANKERDQKRKQLILACKQVVSCLSLTFYNLGFKKKKKKVVNQI